MNELPTHVDLFSGIGGFALAAQWAGFRTIAFCEIDKYCQKILAKNFLENSDCGGLRESGVCEEQSRRTEAISASKIISNIFDFDGTQYRGCSLLTGGFPCQPFSVAGKRRGAADDRAIWPEMFRVADEIATENRKIGKDTWLLAENVPGIIPMELDNVLSDLEGIGYACRSFVIPACAVDARHRRDRLWVVAHSIDSSNRTWRGQDSEANGVSEVNRSSLRGRLLSGTSQERNVADRNGEYWKELQRRHQLGEAIGETPLGWGDERTGRKWLAEPDVGRVAHGIPSRVDRLKGLGNAIVPQVAYEILREIRKLI